MNKVIISHADNYRLENVKEILGATFQNFFGLLAEEKNPLGVGGLIKPGDVATRYMGLKPLKVKYLKYFLDKNFDDVTLENLIIYENGNKIENFFKAGKLYKNFAVGDLWKDLKAFSC